MNPLWTKWIKASIAVSFKQALDDLHLFLEGAPRDTKSLTQWAELRLVGPDYRQLTRGTWEGTLSVNVLIMTKTDLSNAYVQETNVGIVQAAFVNMPVLEYPATTYVGCLRLQQAQMPERLRTQLIGKADPSTDMQQAAVEGQYKIDLTE